MGIQGFHFEPQGFSELDQGVEVTGAVPSKTMVVPDDHSHRLNAIAQKGFCIFPRGHMGKLLGEGLKDQVVEPRLFKK